MKAIILTLVIFLFGTNFGMASPYPMKQIIQYKRAQKQTVELPTNFSKQFIIDQKDIDLLAGKTIHHIELVYTKYAESSDFDQKALNSQRITQLKKLLPQINSDNPTWTWLEQTGATTRDVAKGYFHGFVIHYGDKLDHNELGQFFSGLSGKPNEFNVFYPEGGTFDLASGTKINIASNAVSYMDGKPVSGYYTLFYKEYRNPAEIALSGLPMSYDEANFSSIGMYELRAEKDGKELKLIKPMKVDFNCTKIVDDAAFFSMDDDSGDWKKQHDLDFGKNKGQAILVLADVPQDDFGKFGAMPNLTIQWQQIDDKTTKATLDANAWGNFEALEENDQPEGIVSCDSATRTFIIESRKMAVFQEKVFERKFVNGNWRDQNMQGFRGKRVRNGKTGTLLAQGSRDPGHTYPTLVKGLNSPSFGVYNCDQVYRIGTVAQVKPIYMDTETGEPINNGYVTCVMDLSYNGSFSFHPNNLTLNKAGRNAILLFTKDKEIYLIDEIAFGKLDLDSAHTIEMPMKNVTNELKSPSDLKEMLNI